MPSRPDFEAKIRNGLAEFNHLIGPGLMDGKEISFLRVLRTHAGKYHQAPIIKVADGVSLKTLVHELGHWMEDERPELLKTMHDFWKRRTQGDAFEDLATLYPDGLGRKMQGEFAKKDQWISPYMGKVYFEKNKALSTLPGPGKTFAATELVSMGLEMLWKDPVQLALKDPEYFDLIWGIIHGLN